MYKVSAEFLVSHHTLPLFHLHTRKLRDNGNPPLSTLLAASPSSLQIRVRFTNVKINIKLQLDNLKTRALLANSKMVKQFINFTK